MEKKKINTAVLLAAGMGERLKPYTNEKPKCLVQVGNNTLLGHMLDALEMAQFSKVIIVTGYKSNKIKHYVDTYSTQLTVEFVHNEIYDTTNNIYSLWLAGNLITGAFALFETDLIFSPDFLEEITQVDKIALARYNESIHHGTTAEVTDTGWLKKMFIKESPPLGVKIYKTVNIYSFSSGTWRKVLNEIETYIQQGETNIFYEKAINNLVVNGQISFKMVDMSNVWWDEIDTPEDLGRVESNIMSHQDEIIRSRKHDSL